ncbi:MAG: hypothetical protein PVG06_18480 [Desulfobacterales bacterium]|jgi:hypothetical protein
MTGEISTYQKLPGKKKGFLIGHHTLWQGSDHLLQIYSRLGVEDYKRFYFNDIQAIIARKTGMGMVLNFVLGVSTILFGIFAVTSEGGLSIFNTIIAGVLLLIWIIHFLRGPTCETFLLTAVQTEKLHSLHRLKTTQPVMNRLRTLIEKRQGRINPETFAQPSAHPTTLQTRRTTAGANERILKARKSEKGRVHLALFALLLADGVFIGFSFFYTHVALSLLSTAVSMVMGICVIVALVKQHESNLKQSLRTMTWAALGYVCFSFVAGYVVSLTLTFKHPEIWQNQWELFKLLSSISPWESPMLMTVNIIALGGAILIGIPGLLMLKNPQQVNCQSAAMQTKRAPASTPKRIS